VDSVIDVGIPAALACICALLVLLSAIDRWRAYRRRRAGLRIDAWMTRRGLLLRGKVAQRLREAGHRWDGRS
jgi:hypothetical protein